MIISITNVSKSFNENKVLNSLTMKIDSGVCMGLVGPNGAGKTTLIRTMLGLYDADGDISFDGANVFKIDMAENKILFVLETSGLLRNLNVKENIEFFSRVYSPNESANIRKEKIYKILKRIELFTSADKNVKALSRGMKQRLVIGRTMVVCPNVLILDEPYLGLDVEAQIFLTDYIQNLKEKGVTILISSHDLGHLQKVCDEISFINKGCIVEKILVEKSMDLEKVYKNLYVKE